MPDTALLRRRLIRALDLTPLALVGVTSVACMGERVEAKQERLEAAKQREEAARQAELAAADAQQAKFEADAERERAAETAAAAKAQAEQAKLLAEQAKLLEVPEMPTPLPNFSCPPGKWCATATIAKRYAGEAVEGNPDALGCPGHVAQNHALQEEISAHPPWDMGDAYLDPAATKAERDQGNADLCCYEWQRLCGGGRPLLDDGQPKFAALVRADDRVLGSRSITIDDAALQAKIARGWLEDARMEHASIASFLRAEAELAALDAPAALREACLRAADDERRHARDCFAIAAAYGQAWHPGELPHASLRRPALEQLAVDTLLEGGIGETIAALMARRAARGVEDQPQLGAVLERIAVDELEHAALAWQTIAWALRQGGESVRVALMAAAAQARPDEFALPVAEPHADRLARHGRLDARATARAIRDAWVELIDPMLVRLGQLGSRSCPSIAIN